MNYLKAATLSLLSTVLLVAAADPAKPAPAAAPKGPSPEAIQKVTQAKQRLDGAMKNLEETGKRAADAKGKLDQTKKELDTVPAGAPPDSRNRADAEMRIKEVTGKLAAVEGKNKELAAKIDAGKRGLDAMKKGIDEMKQKKAPAAVVEKAVKDLGMFEAGLKRDQAEAEQIAKDLPGLKKRAQDAEADLKRIASEPVKPNPAKAKAEAAHAGAMTIFQETDKNRQKASEEVMKAKADFAAAEAALKKP